jgi:hypothetical protein
MKLSKNTIDVLRWYARTQDRLRIVPGNRITGVGGEKLTGKGTRRYAHLNGGRSKHVFFDAQVPDFFPVDCGIPSVKRLLKCIAENTEVSFDVPGRIELRDGRGRISLATEDVLFFSNRNYYKTLSYSQSLFLHHDDVFALRRLKLKNGRVELSAATANSNVRIICYEAGVEGSVQHDFELRVPQTWSNDLSIVFKHSALILSEGSFNVDFSECGVGRFRWLHGEVTLYVQFEKTLSSFGAASREAQYKAERGALNSDARTESVADTIKPN